MTVTRGSGAVASFQNGYNGTVNRFVPVKLGTANGVHITVIPATAVTDKIIGVTSSDATVQYQGIDVVTNIGDTVKCKLGGSETCSVGDFIVVDDTADSASNLVTVRALTYTAVTGARSRTIIGKALTAGAAGDYIEIQLLLQEVAV